MAALAVPAPALSAPGPATPRIVADGWTLLAVWASGTDGGGGELLARSWSPGRPPGVVRRVAPGGTLLSLDARGGEAVAVFGRSWATSGETLLATTRQNGRWGSPVVLMRRHGSWYPRDGAGALTSRGVSVVAWIGQHPVQPSQLRVRESGGDLAAPRSILIDRAAPVIDLPMLAAADDGSLALAWEAEGVVRVAARAADGTWSPPATLSTAAALVTLTSRPGAGAPLIVWSTVVHGRWTSYAATVGPDGTLSSRRRLPGAVDRSAAAVGPGGRAVVAWLVHGGRRGRTVLVRAETRTPSGRWRSPVTLSLPWRIPSPDGEPVVAFASDGRAVVAWGRLGVVQARVLARGRWSRTQDLVGSRSEPAIAPGAAGVGHDLVVATVWPAAGGAGRLRVRTVR